MDPSWHSYCSNAGNSNLTSGTITGGRPPRYWIAAKRDVGKACVKHPAHNTKNWERRFSPRSLDPKWENNWLLFVKYELH